MISITHRRAAPVPRDVSQGTLAKVDCGATRKYVSGFRRGQGERTRAAIVEATLALVAAGNFRPDALTIAAQVGCHPSAIMRHFGALHLLYRVIACEHAGAVLEALGIEPPPLRMWVRPAHDGAAERPGLDRHDRRAESVVTPLALKGPTEAAFELSALCGRLPLAWRYEPPIVTTLRRTFRRGAPESLIHRLAGGPAAWRQLNERWNLDGRAVDTRAPASVDLPEPLGAPLSIAERRIALLQLADECARAGAVLPTLTALGRYFGVSRHVIAYDLEVLRESGKLSWRLVSDGLNGVRRAPVSP